MKAVTFIRDDDGAQRLVHSPDMTIPELIEMLHSALSMATSIHEIRRQP